MNTKYKVLFWDLDHTLWDFDANSAATLKVLYDEYRLNEKGVDDFDVFVPRYEYHNELLWSKLRAGTISREDLRWKRMELILAEYGIVDMDLTLKMSHRYLQILPKQGLLLPGAVDVLEHCAAQGYAMHIITNGFETTQREKLATSKIGHYFEHMITSERANAMKPHAPIFECALALANAEVSESLMIGDSYEADIEGAIQIGMDQVYYNLHDKKDFVVQPTYVIRHLDELKEIL